VGIEYQIDPARRVVFIRCAGRVSISEVFQAAGQLRADPNFDPAFNALIDFTELTKVDAAYAEVSQFAKSQNGSPFSLHARRVVVAPQDFAYGIARMYQALRGEAEFLVVRTHEEASRLLALDRDAAAS